MKPLSSRRRHPPARLPARRFGSARRPARCRGRASLICERLERRWMLDATALGLLGAEPIDRVGDIDTSPAVEYTFEAGAGDLVSMNVRPVRAGADFALALYSADAAGPPRQLVVNDSATAGTTSPAIDWIAPPDGGRFRLVVTASGTGGRNDNSFRMSIRRQDSRFTLAPDDAHATHDIALAADGRISLVGAAPLGGTSQLALYDAAGTLVTTSGATDPAAGPRIDQFVRAGAYRVGVIGGVQRPLTVVCGVSPSTQAIEDPIAGTSPGSLGTADFNGDGWIDVVTRGYGGVALLLGNGDGTFAERRSIGLGSVDWLATGDVDADGRLDIVTGSGSFSDQQGTVAVHLGNGDGTFREAVSVPSGKGLSGLAAADVNGDGRLDVVTMNAGYPDYGDTVSVFLANADGTLAAPRTMRLGSRPQAITTVDVDGDGRIDIVAACQGVGPDDVSTVAVVVLSGIGDGTFAAPRTFRGAGYSVSGVKAGDVDGDGRTDIVTHGYFGVSVLLADAGGGFREPQNHEASGYEAMDVADVNHDGRADVVVVNFADNEISVLVARPGGGFAPERVFTVGAGPKAVAIADVDGDDNVDILVANSAGNSVSVLPGAGDGTFSSRQVFPAGATPYGVATADFNGDGRPDAVTVTTAAVNAVAVFLGTGDGSVRDKREFVIQGSPLDAKTGDFNGDGRIDIVVLNRDSVSFLPGNGDGTFAEERTISDALGEASWSAEKHWALGDVDGDGDIDIVIGAYDPDRGADHFSTVAVLVGNGDGTFAAAPRASVLAGERLNGLAVADVNGDGRLDVITTNGSGSYPDYGNTVAVLLGNGDGTLGEPRLFPVGARPLAVTTTDVDRDGAIDVVIKVVGYPAKLVVLRGDGRGAFVRGGEFAVGEGNSSRREWINAADYDGDGRIDIATADYFDNTVSVLLGDGDGRFAARRSFIVGRNPNGLSTADCNGDGRLDIVTSNFFSNSITVLLNNGTGLFALPAVFAGSFPANLATADFNADGVADVVAASGNDDVAAVLLGNRDGSFAARRVFGVGSSPYGVAVADFDGDGRIDIVTADSSSNTVSVLRGDGGGGFSPRVSFPVGIWPRGVTTADVDGDGRVDIVTANWLYDTVSVLLNKGLDDDGAPTFAGRVDASGDRIDLHVGVSPWCVVAADVDGDGRIDLVTSNSDDDSVSVLFGNGDGTFLDQVKFAVGASPWRVSVSDVDGDGRLDLVTANEGSPRDAAGDPGPGGTVSVLRGRGGRAFAAQQVLPVGRSPYGLSVLDVDGDGRIDIITANNGSGTISVLSGRGDGTFAPARAFAAGPGAARTLPIDVDGDGRTEILTANWGDGTVTVLRDDGADGFVIDVAEERGLKMLAVDLRSTTIGVSQAVASASLDGGTAADTLTLDRDGAITVRYGADPTRHGMRIRAPRISGTDSPAFDATVIAGPGGVGRVVAIDTQRAGLFVARAAADGELDRIGRLRAAGAPAGSGAAPALARLARGVLPPGGGGGLSGDGRGREIDRLMDLNGDGWGDIVVANPGAGTVDILVSGPDGWFDDGAWQRLAAGGGPTDVLIADIDGDGAADLMVANQVSGDVSVRSGVPGVVGSEAFTAATGFGAEYRYRTSAAVRGFDIDPVSGRGGAIAPQQLTSIALGDVDGDGAADIVATSDAGRSFAILHGRPGRGFGPPETILARADGAAVTTSGGSAVSDVVLGDLARDGVADIVLLDRVRETLSIYHRGRRAGAATVPPAALVSLAGVAPKSISLADVTGPGARPDGILDILVGNDFGDVLTLEGVGDGTFKSVVRAERTVALLAGDLDGDGRDELIYGNRALDTVTVEQPDPGRQGEFAKVLEATRAEGILGPSGVAMVTEPDSGLRHLIVVNGGSNEVLLFRRTSSGGANAFSSPERFYVGTDPTAVAVGDIDRDGIPDVIVANAGSNDISVLRGRLIDRRYGLAPGVRLRSGGSSPERVVLADLLGSDGAPGTDGQLDIAVTNRGGGGSAVILRGIAGGFFDDVLPAFLPMAFPAPGPIVTIPRVGAAPMIVVGSTTANMFQVFDPSAGRYGASTTYSSGGASLATTSLGGSTYLAAGSTATGSISLFIGSATGFLPLGFSVQGPSGVSGLAFDSAGRLFGVGASGGGAIGLFTLDSSGESSASMAVFSQAQAFVTRVVFTPLQTAGVGLVAALVTSGGIAIAEKEPGTAAETSDGDGDADGGGGTDESRAAEDDPARPGDDGGEEDEAEAESNPLLDFVLDVEGDLRTWNERLIARLLDRAADESGSADGAADHDPAVESEAEPVPVDPTDREPAGAEAGTEAGLPAAVPAGSGSDAGVAGRAGDGGRAPEVGVQRRPAAALIGGDDAWLTGDTVIPAAPIRTAVPGDEGGELLVAIWRALVALFRLA